MSEVMYDRLHRASRVQWATLVLAILACAFSFVAMLRAGDAAEQARHASSSASGAGDPASAEIQLLRRELIEDGVITP